MSQGSVSRSQHRGTPLILILSLSCSPWPKALSQCLVITESTSFAQALSSISTSIWARAGLWPLQLPYTTHPNFATFSDSTQSLIWGLLTEIKQKPELFTVAEVNYYFLHLKYFLSTSPDGGKSRAMCDISDISDISYFSRIPAILMHQTGDWRN